jgi:hypothetical protein
MIPAMIPFQGEWEPFEEQIYDSFCSTLVENAPFFRGRRVVCRYEPAVKNKHDCFWHCISEGPVEADRTIDLARAQRISWIAWMIENADSSDDIVVIDQKRGRNDRVVILHKVEKYAVVLGIARNVCPLITTFCPRDRKFERLLEEYEDQKR